MAADLPTDYLDGQILIAMPGMEDPRFARSLVYVCAHSSEGAMGIILNQLSPQLTFPQLLLQLDVISEGEQIRLPALAKRMRVMQGGPVETGRGFVLHSADYHVENATLPIDDGVSLTTTLEILKAIADGRGPTDAMIALGYAGWQPGQLETEIQANGWLHCEADVGLVFDIDLDTKYDRAMRKIGINIGMLSRDAGHA